MSSGGVNVMPSGMAAHPPGGTERFSDEKTSKPLEVGEPRAGNFAFLADRVALRLRFRWMERFVFGGRPRFFLPVLGSVSKVAMA